MQELVETDFKIYATIDESSTGSELWGVSFSVVLPLVWIDFDVKLVKDDAALSWTTANEVNTDEFIVERSLDGNVFEAVGRVKSKDIPGTHTYNFNDPAINSLGKDLIYYRIKQIDIDSRKSYSVVVALNLKKTNGLRVYPNPAINEIRLDSEQLNGRVQYQVFDNTGKIVLKESKFLSGNLMIDISKLACGSYYLDVKGDGLTRVIPFIKKF